ncbi:MAG: DUF2336 domain-containing protein [Sphingomonas sp.]
MRARALTADARAEYRLRVAIDDFFLPDNARLDDRLRAALAIAISGMTASVDVALRQHAARLLASRDAPELAERLRAEPRTVLDRLVAAGLMRDTDLMRELIGRVRSDVLSESLPVQAPEEFDRPSLLVRLSQSDDHVIASGAMALLGAENRRRLTAPTDLPSWSDLPADLHHRLVWWVAAALREQLACVAGGALPALDHALAEAALRHIGAHDEGDRVEAVAMRLAVAIDARADELALLLVEALADRRLSLFVALIAHALGLNFGDAREIVLDPVGDQLWPVLRALEIDRTSIARIGLALTEADPRRDVEAFADSIDEIADLAPINARAAVAPLLLHPDYRAAMLALARGAVA